MPNCFPYGDKCNIPIVCRNTEKRIWQSTLRIHRAEERPPWPCECALKVISHAPLLFFWWHKLFAGRSYLFFLVWLVFFSCFICFEMLRNSMLTKWREKNAAMSVGKFFFFLLLHFCILLVHLRLVRQTDISIFLKVLNW